MAMNDETRAAVLEAVKTAIITELRGLEIYRAAAEKAEDPAAKQMFLALAEEEKEHKEFLEKNFRSLLEKGEWSVPATPENLGGLDHPPIITPEFLERVRGGDFEMAIVSAGVELERAAIDYYARQAKESPDEETRKVFEFLSKWEESHLRQLDELQSHLRDQYFADRGFSPM